MIKLASLIVNNTAIKFSPRLHGRSTVVYENRMYVYGGRGADASPLTNNLYVYDFDTDSNAAVLSLVNQTNSGPVCFFCGAVMIDDTRMLILTKEIAGLSMVNATNDTIVQPFIFDFKTSSWSIDNRTPIFDESLKHVFQIRHQHATVLGDDGLIYTIGGVDYFRFGLVAKTSWYYNPSDNSYGIIADFNQTSYTAVGHNAFRLSYHSPFEMKILDTVSKSWVSPQLIKDNKSGMVPRDAGSSVTFHGGKYVCIYGGKKDSGTIYSDGYVINLETMTSSLLEIPTNNYFVTPRYHAHLSVISERYLVFAFGLYKFIGPLEISSIELLQLPTTEEIQNSNLEAGESFPNLTWVVPTSSNVDPEAKTTSRLSGPIILSIIFAVPVTMLITFVAIAILNRRKITGKIQSKSNRIYMAGIFKWAWPQSILDSPISSTDSFENKENMTIPDIRVCYSGWTYYSDYDGGDGAFPTLRCQNLESIDIKRGCGDIVVLNRTFVTPSFPGQFGSTKCYMHKSDQDKSVVTKDAPTVLFYHNGRSNLKRQTVYIELYEPKKNPNRVVYLNETIDGFDIETTDKWLDSERAGKSKSEVVNQFLAVYPDSYVSLQFDVVNTLKIDTDSKWNLLGIFPKFIHTSELSITHTDVLNHDTYVGSTQGSTVYLGEIQISPASFNVKTITEKRDVTVVNTLGVFAGIVSMLLAFHIFLFGARPTDPWGIFQKASIRRNQKQKKKEEMEKYFYIPEVESVPFITPVHQRFSSIHKVNFQQNEKPKMTQEDSETELMTTKSYTHIEYSSDNNEDTETPRSAYDLNDVGDRLAQLEGRNQILELVLKSYYIDDKIFQELSASNGKKTPNMERSDSGKVV
ncbi:hypothetical protein INT48_007957 [Thamnidium elegans]|uniref:Uncharacterized protein n=1 Tax=Thamnidium elegans TaxID=101142 RepID=A0A8H7VUT8_9FUNG|nr:hypothetical protein INT48_007957 [Thamnidium elegans]